MTVNHDVIGLYKLYENKFADYNLMFKQLDMSPSSYTRLLHFLNEMDSVYVPTLSSIVCVEDYTNKLLQKAKNFVLFQDDVIIGLLAVYVNHTNFSSYISSIGIIPQFQGLGLASVLLNFIEEYSILVGVTTVMLEVIPENLAATTCYIKNGYKKEALTKRNSIIMSKKLV